MNKPNIVMILADDMGYGDIGAFGNCDVETPALDRLAAEGIRLTQHYSGSAVCAPARASLMTGRYPHRTGAIDTYEASGYDRLATREITLANLLQAQGYKTGCFGKWHLGAIDPRYHPNNRGFDEFAGFRGGWQDYWDWRLDYNGQFQKADGRYLTDVLTDEAVGFIERHEREPFFLHVTYNAPHFPFQAPEEDIEPFRETGKFDEGVSIIYGMNRRMDRGIGQILETLDRLGLRDNTLFWFASDNGPQLSNAPKEGMNFDRFNAHLKGGKCTVFEGGIRVPAIVRWPDGMLGGGRLCRDMLHFTDWLPTVAALAGAEAPKDRTIDGRDIMPVLRGESHDVNTRRFWQWNRYEPVKTCNAAMRDGDWKLIRPRIPEALKVADDEGARDRAMKFEPETITEIRGNPFPDREIPPPPPPLLFNIKSDMGEQNNLAAQEPEILARMQNDLDAWFDEVEAERKSIED